MIKIDNFIKLFEGAVPHSATGASPQSPTGNSQNA